MTLDELRTFLASGETQTLECKESTGQRGEACRTLCAFLNGQGGTVVFGVTRKGNLTGQLMADTTKRDLFEAFQKFEPSVDVEVIYVPVDETHTAIVCNVDKGNNRPYVYDGRPYKRMQSSTTLMSQEEYERNLSERGGFRSDWDLQENPAFTLSEIDFEEVKKTARMAVRVGRLDSDVDTNDAILLLKKFKVMRGDRLLNAAAVLFGNDDLFGYPQCEIKMARFKGTGKNEFGDERREEGNIFKLLSAAMQFCFKHLNLSARILPTQIERDEHLEIPPEALREAILNALVHRQYSKNGSVSLAIYDDRLEVTSPGGFPPGKTVEQIIAGHESEPRNERIAHVLYLRKTIETWGCGFDRIMSECAREGVLPPTVVEKDGYVRLIFVRSVQSGGDAALIGAGHCNELGKMSRKRVAKGGREADELGQKPSEVSRQNGQENAKPGKKKGAEVGKKSAVQKSFEKKARLMLEHALPSVRLDARNNMIRTLAAMATDPTASILCLTGMTALPRGTVRNAQEMLKELGLVFRVGGDRGGHWMISWKDKEK